MSEFTGNIDISSALAASGPSLLSKGLRFTGAAALGLGASSVFALAPSVAQADGSCSISTVEAGPGKNGAPSVDDVTITVPEDSPGCTVDLSETFTPSDATLTASFGGFAGNISLNGKSLSLHPYLDANGTFVGSETATNDQDSDTGSLTINIPNSPEETAPDVVSVTYAGSVTSVNNPTSRVTLKVGYINTNDGTDVASTISGVVKSQCGYGDIPFTGVTVVDKVDTRSFNRSVSESGSFDIPNLQRGPATLEWTATNGNEGSVPLQVTGQDGNADCVPAVSADAPAAPSSGTNPDVQPGVANGSGSGSSEGTSGDNSNNGEQGPSSEPAAVATTPAAGSTAGKPFKPSGVGGRQADLDPTGKPTPIEITADDIAYGKKLAEKTGWQQIGDVYKFVGKYGLLVAGVGAIAATPFVIRRKIASKTK